MGGATSTNKAAGEHAAKRWSVKKAPAPPLGSCERQFERDLAPQPSRRSPRPAMRPPELETCRLDHSLAAWNRSKHQGMPLQRCYFVGDGNGYVHAVAIGGEQATAAESLLAEAEPGEGAGTEAGAAAEAGVEAGVERAGARRWAYRLGQGGGVECSPTLSKGGETLYVAGSDACVYAFSTARGQLRWQSEPLAGHAVWSGLELGVVPFPGTAGATALFIGSDDGHVTALDAYTGSCFWSSENAAGGAIRTRPRVAAGGKSVVVGCCDGTARALSAYDGTELWRTPPPGTRSRYGQLLGDPELSEDGATVFVGCTGAGLLALRVATGEEVWTCRAVGDPGLSGPVLGKGGATLYVGSWDRRLHCVAARDGAVQWQYDTGACTADASPALSADGGTVYCAADDGHVHAVDAASGTPRWRARAPGSGVPRPFRVTPSVAADGSVVLVADMDGKVFALSAADGRPCWPGPGYFEVGAAVTYTLGVLGP